MTPIESAIIFIDSSKHLQVPSFEEDELTTNRVWSFLGSGADGT